MVLPDLRRLAARDLYGTRGSQRRRRAVRAEFFAGAAGCTALGILALAHGGGGWILVGVWLVGAGANYVPLALEAQRLSRPGALDAELPKPDGGAWLDHDFRNWRKRSFRPATEAIGLVAARPYDLRHSFASLLIHEGRPLMEIADQLGHSVETLLRHYAHLIAEMTGQPPIPAERAIEKARAEMGRK